MLTTACSSLAVEKAFANVYFANVQLHTTLSTTTASVGGLWHANVLSAVPNLTQLKTLHLSVSNKDYRQSIMLQRLAACLESLERLSMEGCTLSTGQTNYLAAGMERAVAHVRSAGSFRSEPTLAEVLAPTLCNSVVSLHVDLR
ncbi:TPA: hypothetical protein ACH3X3_012299 [Trebouxia sp. C0006]